MKIIKWLINFYFISTIVCSLVGRRLVQHKLSLRGLRAAARWSIYNKHKQARDFLFQ